MKQLPAGKFYGHTHEKVNIDGIILTDTEYTVDKVDWHYHENPYFTFILQGNVLEGNKKEIYTCSPGTLLFHNWQEPHYNIKPPGFTRGFHIELEQTWLENFSMDLQYLQGNLRLTSPDLKFLLYKIFRETKINDHTTALSIHVSLLQILAEMHQAQDTLPGRKPLWISKLKDILHDRCCGKLSLTELSAAVGIHPVHLSRGFPKYFHCGLGEYIRKLKIEKSLSLLSSREISLTAISFECGFSDQSHFIRCFKEMTGVNPMVYRKILCG